jgi:hypothetical protein
MPGGVQVALVLGVIVIVCASAVHVVCADLGRGARASTLMHW